MELLTLLVQLGVLGIRLNTGCLLYTSQSGVDVEAGYEVVERIKKHVARTERAGVMGADVYKRQQKNLKP